MVISKAYPQIWIVFLLVIITTFFIQMIIGSYTVLKKHAIEEFMSLNTGVSHYSYFKITNLKNVFLSIISDQDVLALHVDFSSLEKLRKDRLLALERGILFEATEVPATLIFKNKTYKAQISLKGDLKDHWSSERRMSLKLKLKDGFILGHRRFSLQKPNSRQYPDNDLFLAIAESVGVSANQMKYINIEFNGQNWGKMNLEPIIDKYALELSEKKESLVLKFDDQKEWNYRILKTKNGTYVREYKVFDLLFDANIMQEKSFKASSLKMAQYSYLLHSLKNKQVDVLATDKFCKAIVLSEIWGSAHALANSNSRYYFNPYTLKLEPVLSDQSKIKRRSIEQDAIKKKWNYWDIELYDLIRTGPINSFRSCITKALKSITKTELNLTSTARLIHAEFPNDPPVKIGIVQQNLQYLIENFESVFFPNSEQTKNTLKSFSINLQQLKNIKEWASVQQFDDGTLWILNRLPINLEIIEISNEEDRVSFIDQPEILGPQAKTLKGLSPRKYISSPFVYKTNFTDLTMPISIVVRALGQKQIIRPLSNLPSGEKLYNPLIISDPEFSPQELYNDGENCVIERGSSVVITKPVTLNCVLTVKEGTKLSFNNGAYLIIKGGLIIDGTKKKPVMMTSHGNEKTWGGLYVLGDGAQSKISNLIVENISELSDGLLNLTGAVTFYDSVLDIDGLTIQNSHAEDALNIVKSTFKLENISIIHSKSDGIDFDFSDGLIRYAKFENIGGDALDFSGSKVIADHVAAVAIKDKAFSIGERTDFEGSNLLIELAGVGVAVKDGSVAEISTLTVNESKFFDAMTYNKKEFYPPPSLHLIEYSNCGDRYLRSLESSLYCNDNLLPPKTGDIESMYKTGFMKKNGSLTN